MATIRQTNFSAGELDPELHGRTDLPVYGKGLKTCRNFFITKQGAAMSRPGTTFVAEAKLGVTEDDTDGVRLIPFVYSDERSYVLEFGYGYIRVYSLGVLVAEVNATAITVDLLPKLKYAQVGNVLTVCVPHVSFEAAYELRRVAHATWTWERTDLTPPEAVLPDVGDSFFTNPFNPGTVSTLISTTPFVIVASSIGVEDDDHPEREWVHAFTAIMQHRDSGVILESLATVVQYSHTDGVDVAPFNPTLSELNDQKLAIYPDMPLTLKRLATVDALDTEYRTLGFRIYRGRGDLLGWIGDTRGREFIDTGEEPDYSVQPPLGSSPFQFRRGTTTTVRVPLAVAFFEERRCFGGMLGDDDETPSEPATIVTSATGDYYNFDTRLAIHVSGEALVFELAARRRETIRHLVPLRRLVVLTDQAAWTVGGHAGSPLDFDSIDARVADDVGSSHATPVIVDGAVLFARTKGFGLRGLVPQEDSTPYSGFDASAGARHLVRGSQRSIVEMAYQEDPFGIVWVVRADGALLSLTFDRDNQMAAWARHDTDGEFESVCCVPEGDEDAVYVVVKRTVNEEEVRYIERFTSRVRRVLESDDDPEYVTPPAVTDTDSLFPTDVCTDCTFTYAGALPTGNLISDPGLLYLLGKEVYVTGRGMAVMGPYVVTVEGVNGEVQMETDVTFEENAVNDSGTPIWVAHVGLAFTADLETLAVRGDATLKQKTVSEVGFELDETRGVQAGQDFDHLDDWQQREVSDSYDSPSAATLLLNVPVENAWDTNARACLRQTLPLPVTVVGISREVVPGGKSSGEG